MKDAVWGEPHAAVDTGPHTKRLSSCIPLHCSKGNSGVVYKQHFFICTLPMTSTDSFDVRETSQSLVRSLMAIHYMPLENTEVSEAARECGCPFPN